MLLQTNIKRQSVIQRGNLTIDPQCCTVLFRSRKYQSVSKRIRCPYPAGKVSRLGAFAGTDI